MRRGDDIDHLELFERDGWTCGICGEPINPLLRFPDMNAASVDHIVPLACEGEHVWQNCQASHRRCNEAKADRLTVYSC